MIGLLGAQSLSRFRGWSVGALAIAGGFLLLLSLFSQSSRAQEGRRILADVDVKRTFEDGLSAYRSQEYVLAADKLHSVLREGSPVVFDEENGSAPYWLGKVYEARGRRQIARQVWGASVMRSLDDGWLDIQSADAYVRSVFRDSVREKYSAASHIFLRLLEEADRSLTGEEREAIQRHLLQMVFLLPDRIREEMLRGTEEEPIVNREREGGHALAAWWRKQDSKPATSKNERLIEHLRRVEHARAHYQHDRSPSGFDDRGRIYVRLGEPTLVRSVDFHSRDLLDVLRRIDKSMGNNLSVNLASFASNEFWLYERGEAPYPYLFVDNGEGYRIGGIDDLVPSRLSTNMRGRTGRGGAKADVVLEAMRTAYRQLATYHMEYGPGFNQLDRYLNTLEEARIRHRATSGDRLSTRSNRSDNSALRQQAGALGGLSSEPGEMARSALSRAKQDQAQMAQNRKEDVPRQETETLNDAATLPVAARVARFLETDGTTSTRVYWGLSRQDLENTEEGILASGPRLVTLSVRKGGREHRARQVDRKQYLIDGFQGENDVIVADEQIQVGGDTATYHLGLQWDQYGVDTDGETPRAEKKLRTGIAKVDSIEALTASPQQLEMSDLVPAVHHSETGLPSLRRQLEHPYPFTKITEETALAFYFELYHLQKGTNDQTRYTIQYEMHRQTDRGRFKKLIQGSEQRRTSVSTTRKGSTTREKEYILLDLDDWEIEEESKLKVTIQVTDERTGQQIERAAQFQVVPEGE